MKKIKLLFVCSIAVVLSACGGEQGENTNPQQELNSQQEKNNNQETENVGKEKMNIPEKYEAENDNVIFTTEIHVNQEVRNQSGLKNVTVVRKKIDKDKVYQQLFQGVEVETEDKQEITLNDGSSITEYYYYGKNKEFLNVSPRVVQYSTAFYNYIYNCVDLSEGGNLNSYAQDTDFSFCSREDALKNISTELGQMGIELGEIEYQLYALDYQTLQQNEYAMDMDGNEDTSIYKDNWSEEDNCYYFFIRQKVGNLPEYHPYSDLFKNPIEENAPIKVLYSKNGIESLEIERLYDFTESEDETIELMSFDKVAETVAYKYNQLLTGAKYVITDATLYYMTENVGDGTYQMFPVWIFNVEETIESNGETTSSSLLVFVNAQTGEEIAMEDKY